MLPNPTIFGQTYDWFELLVNLAIVVGTIVILLRYRYWKFYGFLKPILFFVSLLVLGNFGARSLEAIEAILTNSPTAEQYSFWELVIGRQGGKRWFGTLLVNFIAVYLLIKITGKINLLGLLDEIIIVASGGVVIGKIGCFLSGHGCYGVPTNLPVGMRVPYGSMPSILPVHPTALYDAIIYAILFVVLWQLSKNKKYNGQITIVFLFTVCIASILVEIIRINEPVIFNMSLAQIVYIFLLIGTIIFYRNRHQSILHQSPIIT